MQDNNRDSLSNGNILTDSEYALRYQPIPKSMIKPQTPVQSGDDKISSANNNNNPSDNNDNGK